MDNLPFVTVVMPVRNEAGFIRRSLGAVLAQDYPQDRMEIIVADGNSTDGTWEITESFLTQVPGLRLIDNPGQIVPTGLNGAIAQARGEIIVRVDGHCEIERDYVRRSVQHLQGGTVDAVGGSLETVGETPLAQVIAVAMSSVFGVGGSAFRTVSNKSMLTDTVAFPAYTRSIIHRAGPYDEELVRNQDDEYNYRIRKLGAKVLLASDVRSRYYSRSNLRSLWRQYFQYGYWKVRVMQKHHRQMRLRQFIPPLFVAALFVSLLISPFSLVGVWLLCISTSSYIIANLAASILTARNKKTSRQMLLPVAFAAMHIAYGCGFLFGLIRFWNRWGDRQSRYVDPRLSGSEATSNENGLASTGQ